MRKSKIRVRRSSFLQAFKQSSFVSSIFQVGRDFDDDVAEFALLMNSSRARQYVVERVEKLGLENISPKAIALLALIASQTGDEALGNCVESECHKPSDLSIESFSRCALHLDTLAVEDFPRSNMNLSEEPLNEHPMIGESIDEFEIKRTALIEQHLHKWIAFHGRRIVAVSQTEQEALAHCVEEGLSEDECFAFFAEPLTDLESAFRFS